MDASVVIATYNRRNLLEKSLECLFCQNYPADKYEVIIVDDGSTDGTKKMISGKRSTCRLKYLQHRKRKGPGKARNFGIREAKGEIIIFIDSDILAPPEFINEHIVLHKKHKNVIVDGPAINARKVEGVFNSRWGKLLAFLDFFGASFITANTSCRRENLIKAGLFDEEFGKRYGWFDRELGFRLKEMGIRRIKNRRAYAFHIKKGGAGSFAQLCEKARDRGINAALYYRKHPSRNVKREIRFRYLFYDKLIFFRSWMEKYLEKRTSLSISDKRSPLLNLLIDLYLLHIYADGLRRGLKKYGGEKK